MTRKARSACDKYALDGHKLTLHPIRVARWLEAGEEWGKAKEIYPIYMEVSPSGACNYRCSFCALDYLEYKPKFLDTTLMDERFAEMGDRGVRSIMFGGEGEPLIHKRLDELSASVRRAGMDLGMTTNGRLLKPAFIESSLEHFSWIKISLNAGTPQTFAAVHGTSEDNFVKVIENARCAVEFKKTNGLACTIGVQILMLPENMAEVTLLGRICRDEIGADYLVVKPYSQHIFSHTTRYKDMRHSGLDELKAECAALSTPEFSCIIRSRAISRSDQHKSYTRCLSTPFFWGYVMADHSVYSCSCYLGDPHFNIGNLKEDSFLEVWTSDARKKNWEMLKNEHDIGGCRLNCRMDAINQYLWTLLHPGPHANFI